MIALYKMVLTREELKKRHLSMKQTFLQQSDVILDRAKRAL